mgnify:CR=1 FL=1
MNMTTLPDPLQILFSDEYQLKQNKIDAQRAISRRERRIPITGAEKQSITYRALYGSDGNMFNLGANDYPSYG